MVGVEALAIPAAELEELRDNLQRAFLSGILTVRHGDKWLTYQNMDDMRQALTAAEAAVNTGGGETSAGRHRQVCVRTKRGGLC